MRTRCSNPNHHDYPLYGGRGITVDERWDDFARFVADMGERPAGHTLDRIDNDGPYSPENCRWATGSQQQRNKRRRRLKTHCKHGHPLAGDNIRVREGARVCLACAHRRGIEKAQREKHARELR